MSRKSTQAGYCDYPDYVCALEQSDCPEAVFRSSREMQGAPERAHGGVCLLQESIRGKLLGNCVSSETSSTVCSPNKESCSIGGFSEGFQLSGSCTVDNTKFGRCGKDRCSWSPENCSDNEEWNFPSEDCSCDKVRVGACESNGEFFCAVSKDACDNKSSWLSPLELAAETDVDCFLCNTKKSVSTSSSSTATVYANTLRTDSSFGESANERSSLLSTATTTTINQNSSTQIGPLFYGIVGGLAVSIVVVVALATIRLRQIRVSIEEKKNEKKKLPGSVNMDDTSQFEDVSVL